MNILILGRTYEQHIRFDQESPVKFINQFNIKKGSKVILLDALDTNREKQVQKKDGIEYIDVIGLFQNVQNVLTEIIGTKQLDIVLMDHSTFKFTNNTKENVFYLLFKHNYIKNSTLFFISNIRPKKFNSEKYNYKKEYLESYLDKLKKNKFNKISILVKDNKTEYFLMSSNETTLNEVKAFLHKNRKVPKKDLNKIISTGQEVKNTDTMQKFVFDGTVILHITRTINSLDSPGIKRISLWTHKLFEKHDFICDNNSTNNILYHPMKKGYDVGDHMCYYHKNLNKKKLLGEECTKNSDCKNNNCVENKCKRKPNKK